VLVLPVMRQGGRPRRRIAPARAACHALRHFVALRGSPRTTRTSPTPGHPDGGRKRTPGSRRAARLSASPQPAGAPGISRESFAAGTVSPGA
jgi:hypothetical protein